MDLTDLLARGFTHHEKSPATVQKSDYPQRGGVRYWNVRPVGMEVGDMRVSEKNGEVAPGGAGKRRHGETRRSP